MKTLLATFLIAPILYSATSLSAAPKRLNGFDLSDLSIDHKYMRSGGPPRDGIPSIDTPRFATATDADSFLSADDRVLALSLNGIKKAYPIKILDRHEIVNDRFGSQPVAITYCPLCGSGMAFDADIDGPKSFGVSGLLYNSDVLLYDRQTESLWSQISSTAVTGTMQGKKLTALPIEHTTWKSWRSRHPDTLALSTRQGIYPPDVYDQVVYHGYENSRRIWFPVKNQSKALHPKAWVLGVTIDGQSKAYPLENLPTEGETVADTVGGQPLSIRYDAASDTASAFDAQGTPIPATRLFWFAWYAFHPDTALFEKSK